MRTFFYSSVYAHCELFTVQDFSPNAFIRDRTDFELASAEDFCIFVEPVLVGETVALRVATIVAADK